MELEVFLKKIKKRKNSVIGIILAAILLIGGITFLQPLKYSVKSRLLISQNLSGADPYTVSKSNQYLSNLFSQVVYSSSFFNLANSSGFNIDVSYFGSDYKSQMKTWQKTIEARSVGDTGIMEIYIYHPNTYQAQQIAIAVNQTLISKSFNYQQGGDQVAISVIDQPLTSSFPVKPNLILNFIVAILLGLTSASLWIYFSTEKEQVIKVKKPATITYQKVETNRENAENINPEAPFNLPTTETKTENHNQPRGNINNILR